MIEINGKNIHINGINFNIPYRIEQNREYLILDDRIIVVFDIEEFKEKNNVYCYNFFGEILWKIKNPSKAIAGNINTSWYVGINLNKKNECVVIDFYGRNFLINTETGEPIAMLMCAK